MRYLFVLLTSKTLSNEKDILRPHLYLHRDCYNYPGFIITRHQLYNTSWTLMIGMVISLYGSQPSDALRVRAYVLGLNGITANGKS